MKKLGLSFAVAAVLTVALFFVSRSSFLSYDNLKNLLASIFFVDSITVGDLQLKYQSAGQAKIKILIVPGHDNEYWGTEFKGVKEADLNLALAKELTALLAADPAFDVHLSRTENGYAPFLYDYF